MEEQTKFVPNNYCVDYYNGINKTMHEITIPGWKGYLSLYSKYIILGEYKSYRHLNKIVLIHQDPPPFLLALEQQRLPGRMSTTSKLLSQSVCPSPSHYPCREILLADYHSWVQDNLYMII